MINTSENFEILVAILTIKMQYLQLKWTFLHVVSEVNRNLKCSSLKQYKNLYTLFNQLFSSLSIVSI